MLKFETIYKKVASYAKAKSMPLDSVNFYQAFRNEVNYEAGHNPDCLPFCECGKRVTQAEAEHSKLRKSMSTKAICRQFYFIKQGELQEAVCL